MRIKTFSADVYLLFMYKLNSKLFYIIFTDVHFKQLGSKTEQSLHSLPLGPMKYLKPYDK